MVHLLAEILENATLFSAGDSEIRVTGQHLSSGGILLDVTDSGIGIPPERLAQLNDRLDNPPVADVSVSRHMGLFAVSHLAAWHGVRVRLRAGTPRGLTAPECDMDLVAYEMTRLVEAVGDIITPATRA